MKNVNKQSMSRRLGFALVAIAALCLCAGGAGMLYLYATGAATNAPFPRTLTASLFGATIYGALGIALIGLSRRRPPAATAVSA